MGDVLFNRAGYIKDLKELQYPPPILSYFSTSQTDGTYYFRNPFVKPKSIKDVLSSSLLIVRQGSFHWPYENNPNFNYIPQSFIDWALALPVDGSVLKNVLFQLTGEHEKIIKIIFNNQKYIQFNLIKELNYLIEAIKNLEENIINSLCIAILFFLQGKDLAAKEYIVKCRNIAVSRQMTDHVDLFDEILPLFDSESNINKNLIEVSLIRETDASLALGDQDERLYAEELIKTLEEIGFKVDQVYGSKHEIVNHLKNKKPSILLLIGHGDKKNGYSINYNLSKVHGTLEERFDKEILKDILNEPGYSEFMIFDFVCNKDHFTKKIIYPFDITIFSNAKYELGTFNFPSSYYYSMGFFHKYANTNDIKKCHDSGLISMSIFSYDFLDTYDYIERKVFE
jgi:hypothetical protein